MVNDRGIIHKAVINTGGSVDPVPQGSLLSDSLHGQVDEQRLKQQKFATTSRSFTIASKIRDYMLLVKFSLSFMVVFSAIISYLLAPKIVEYNAKMILLLFA